TVATDAVELTTILDFEDSTEHINNNLENYLEKAWILTQKNAPNSGFIEWSKPTRSTDVCDLIQLEDHRLFLIDNFGFKELKQSPIIHISQTVDPPYGDSRDEFSTLHDTWVKDSVLDRVTMGWYYWEFCQVFASPERTYQRLRSFK
ncbi:hypothetical protein, partial [Crocosphaera sp. XPORK-15E]|uniref:hypothetical protein n=1 Tax=Crocosphaera sp. XPORK-15E TaxID=3110247 RepID=UPI002B1FE2FB